MIAESCQRRETNAADTMADLNQLSSRMRDTIASLMTKVDKTVSGRSTSIDLATAENWLLRPELQEIYGDAIQSGITSKVCIACS